MKMFNKNCKLFSNTSNNNCKPTWVQQSSRTELYNSLALPVILHNQKDKKWLTLLQMKYFITAGHTRFGHKRNEEILE